MSESRPPAWPFLPAPGPAEVLDLRALFGAQITRFELEIGCGKGGFLIERCTSNPELALLGVEVMPDLAAYIADRLQRRGLRNGLIHRGDARLLLAHHLSPGCLSAMHVYCPDPWWKKRHHKRRVLEDPFAAHAARVLAPDGVLHFGSDVDETFALGLRRIMESGLYVLDEEASQALRSVTNFESKAQLDGRPVFRTAFRRRAGAVNSES